MLQLCAPDEGPLDFSSQCVRSAWGALVPLGLVVGLVLFAVWSAVDEKQRLGLLRTYLTLEEVEADVLYDAETDAGEGDEAEVKPQADA
ncbi:hypothetical protein H0H87_012923, partial [Tephrocybe sp. NHM501043]